VVIDTETDGLCAPIHVLELCGQLMEGWQPLGQPFRMLLNHNVHIPHDAVAVHGYDRAYLRQHGQDPRLVHNAFRQYAQNHPLVAHNLSYDWDRCLKPEWARLGIPAAGQRGFCSMMLARRLVPEARSYRLDHLKSLFRLTESRSHQAQADVFTVVELFQKIYKSRLESAGLSSFDSVRSFSTRTPLSRCHGIIRGETKPSTKPGLLN